MGSMTIKLEESEILILDKMIEVGLFSSRDEAAKAAIVKYAFDLGFFNPETMWRELTRRKRRNVLPEQLDKDIESIENET